MRCVCACVRLCMCVCVCVRESHHTCLGHEAGPKAPLVVVTSRNTVYDPRAGVVCVTTPAPTAGTVDDLRHH